MLCCVPKRLADGSPFYDEAPTTPPSVHEIQFELYPEEDAPPPILLPCAICARTFMPQSLENHARICERTAAKKRKPFDSAKQRIQGTELAEFLPKQETRRHQDERGRTVSPTWKKTHDDFLRVIREARGEIMNSRKQCNSLNSSGAPTRANEKGTCPTCNRQFGIKAYDRHVAWCKDRVTSVPVSPAVNLAKERLEARMRYRAPVLKNRRAATREKYSPNSAGNQCKTSSSAPALVKPKESVSMPNCSRESPNKQKPAVVRRPGQLKESPISSGPMKSRLADRTNKLVEDHNHEHLPKTFYRPPHIPVSSRRPPYISIPSLRPKISESISSNEIASPNSTERQSDRNETTFHRVPNDEARNRKACNTKTQKSIVSTRSRSNPKLNDVTVNDKILGVTVKPCKIYKDLQKDDQLVTWKQISRKKSSSQAVDTVINCNFPQEFQLLDLDRQRDEEREIDTITNENRAEKDSSTVKNESDSKLKVYELDEEDDNHISWLDNIQNLNQTYLIRDSKDIEQLEIFPSKWGPIEHSPRVEFYFKDTGETEVYEVDEKKLKRNTKANDEEIKVAEHIIEELNMNNEDKEYNLNVNSEHEAEVLGHRTEEVRPDSEDEKDIQKTNNTNAADWSELYVNEKHAKDKQITMDEDTAEAKKIFEEIKNSLSNISQTLYDSHRHKSSIVDLAALGAPVGYEASSSREFKIDFADNNDLPSNNRSFCSKREDLIFHFNDKSDVAFSDTFIDHNQDYIYFENDRSQCKRDTCCSKGKKYFNNDDFENNNEETNCNFNVDDDSNIRTEISARSIDEKEDTIDEDSRKVHVKHVNNGIDYGDGNTTIENNTRGNNDLKSSITLKDVVVDESQRCREKVVPDANVNLSRCVSNSTKRSVKDCSRDSIEMTHKIKSSINLLRGSTDSLISSVEFVEFTSIEQPAVNRAHEREIIKINRPSRRSRMREILPDIPGEPVETRENSERSANQTYWERASKISRSKLISLDPSCHVGYKLAKRNPRIRILPPVPSSPLIQPRKIELATRPAWCNYVRRRPDFNLVLKARTGTCKDYDPFLLAEQQMNDLLSDTSDQSMIGTSKPQTRDNLYPLCHSSAFVKYPRQPSPVNPDRRTSLIAPPSEFDDLISDFSSDSTETNSISREVFLKDLSSAKDTADLSGLKPVRELGRRLIIDKTKALGGDLIEERRGVIGSADKARKNLDTLMPKIVPKTTRPLINRSNSIRASSAPRSNASSDGKASGDTRKTAAKSIESRRSSDQSLNQRNNNYSSLSGSNLSLSSIVSSEMDIKRSNSVFDELMTSFEEDISFPTLRSFLNNESFDVSSSMLGDGQRNGIVSDEELSSPESYKPQERSKLSNDSAYSSLNRKYSHHGRSTNDVVGRLDEDTIRNETLSQTTKCKMSKFCHECGLRFPENAKFCCECGVRRLAL